MCLFFGLSVEAEPGLFYPNPARYNLYYTLPEDEKGSKITLYSTDGREVLSEHLLNASGSIDISGLSAGMYIVEFKFLKRIIRDKVLVIN